MTSLADVLCAPSTLTLLTTHPNAHALSPQFRIPTSPASILRFALAGDDATLAPALRAPLAAVRLLTRPRAPMPLDAPPLSIVAAQGMSPKKAHEVARMAALVARLAPSLGPSAALRIVDVGAGQGYLTRALKIRLPDAHILALDADAAQTAGAQRYEERTIPDAAPPIAHRTILVEPAALRATIDEWVDTESDGDATSERVPVLFVALHACGSLTVDLLRAVAAAHAAPPARWFPAGVVAVGCCYNLMDPADFPLTENMRSHLPLLTLPPSAFHLAAQVPATWSVPYHNASSMASTTGIVNNQTPLVILPSAALAIRKLVWRALLERALQTATPVLDPSSEATAPPVKKSATVPAHWPRRREQRAPFACELEGKMTKGEPKPEPQLEAAPQDGVGLTPSLARLGRLRDAAYDTWGGFLAIAGARMGMQIPGADGVDIPSYLGESEDEDAWTEEEKKRPVFMWDVGCRSDILSATAPLSSVPHAGDDADDPLNTLVIGDLPRSLRARACELAALHILRCLVGALVEDAVLTDRATWVRNALGIKEAEEDSNFDEPFDLSGVSRGSENHEGDSARQTQMSVRLMNLFDQATGSGRNVALVVTPQYTVRG